MLLIAKLKKLNILIYFQIITLFEFAMAAGEQSVVSHEISDNLESIVAIAEQTTTGSQQTAESSSEVARLSEELQQSVQEFKL